MEFIILGDHRIYFGIQDGMAHETWQYDVLLPGALLCRKEVVCLALGSKGMDNSALGLKYIKGPQNCEKVSMHSSTNSETLK